MDTQQTIDEQFMQEALALAAQARGRTSPNPMVGSVVVKDGRVVGRGYHAKAGAPHGEVVALEDAGTQAQGCNALHHPRTLLPLWTVQTHSTLYQGHYRRRHSACRRRHA